MISKYKFSFFLFILILFLTIIYHLYGKYPINNLSKIGLIESNKSKTSINLARDFYRYNCKSLKRIGGSENIVKQAPPLYRLDGAWFVCFDKGLELVENKCTVLSFGIHQDYTFDIKANNDYKCQVESFDPFVDIINCFKISGVNQKN